MNEVLLDRNLNRHAEGLSTEMTKQRKASSLHEEFAVVMLTCSDEFGNDDEVKHIK
jgi:hypothetical protein